MFNSTWSLYPLQACRRLVSRSALIFLAAFCLTNCGMSQENGLRKIKIQHNWVKDVALMGIYCASEKGFYRSAGLEVEVFSGGPGVDPVIPVVSGDALIGIHTNSASVLIPKSRGVPLKVIGAQYQISPVGLLAKESSGIKSAGDFRGRRIGVIPTSVSILEVVLSLNGLSKDDVEVIVMSPANFLPLLLNDTVDMIMAFEVNQAVELRLRAIPYVFFRLSDLGYRQESYPFFVSEETFDNEREVLSEFMAATVRGWEYALEHPEEAAELSVRKYTEGFDLVKEKEVARLQASLMRSAVTEEHGLFYMNRETWETANQLLVAAGLIEKTVNLGDILTWELLLEGN